MQRETMTRCVRVSNSCGIKFLFHMMMTLNRCEQYLKLIWNTKLVSMTQWLKVYIMKKRFH